MKTSLTSIAGTLVLTLVAVVVSVFPGIAELAQFERVLVLDGQLWRILSGHLTHWNADHLFWDLAVFACLGALCERRNRGAWLMCLVSSAVFIPLLLLALRPEMLTYRGLSGIDSALFIMVIAGMICDFRREREWLGVTLLSTLAAGFVLKLGYEAVTGTTFFVDSTNAGFIPIVEAHIVGGLAGAATTWLRADSSPLYAFPDRTRVLGQAE